MDPLRLQYPAAKGQIEFAALPLIANLHQNGTD
jgi:hypothetical protein